MTNESESRGRCFCGAVEITVMGKPAAVGYCHCASCRQWSASPVNAFTLWTPDAVIVTRGADQLRRYAKTPRSVRMWCQACGGHVMTEHPALGMIDVYAAIVPDVPFEPSVHVNYGDTVLRMHDGLPKQLDFPSEMGGTGTLAPA